MLVHNQSIPKPEGGVQEGQMFLVPLPKSYAGNKIEAPTGQWKDGLCHFCAAGWSHPSLWCSLCCGTIAMAQIMSRMQLTWLGEPGPLKQTKKAFSVVLTLTICYFIYCWSLEFAALPYATPADEPIWLSYSRIGGSLIFSLYSIYALCRTRQSVRTRYQIPETHCQGCEDICCSFWCNCCVTAQIMRHTGEYETYPGVCCSQTGHPPGTPIVV